jgi:hypothetical protein
MSHQAGNETALRPLAREGRLTFSRLTCRGILAASRLAWAGLVWTGQRAEGWDLVLARQEPRS